MPAARDPSRRAASSASRIWPGLESTSNFDSPRRSASALKLSNEPAPNTTRPGNWSWTKSRIARLHGFQRDRDALADADAHGGQRPLLLPVLQLQRRRAGDARARHAERVAERDRAAVRVDVLGIVRNPELAQGGERLAGECLVQLDHIEVAGLEAEPPAQLLGCRRWADAHDAR